MEQNILQIGNSAGVIIPSFFRKQLGLTTGSKVLISVDKTGQALRIKKVLSDKRKSSLTPRFLRIVESVNKQYAKALAVLAEK